MASSLKPVVKTCIAGGAINPYSFVKFSTSSPGSAKSPCVVQCGAGDSPAGVAQNKDAAASGDSVEVAMPGSGALLKTAGVITAGQSIKSDGSGYGVAAATAGDRCGGQAHETSASGDVIGIHVHRFEKYNSDAT